MRSLLLALLCASRLIADCTPPPPAPAPPATPEALLEEGHFLRVAAMLQPVDARSAWLLSRAESALGHLDRALALAEQALAADPERSEYHVQVAATVGRMAASASMFKQLGLARRAKKELDAALELNPRNIDALYGLMLYSWAAPSFIGGDKQKAQEYADALTRIHPARGYLAQAKLASERKDEAAEESFYRKSIEASPDFYEAKVALANFYLSRARPDYDSAQSLACEAVAVDPGRAEAWKVLAFVSARCQCWDDLFTVLEYAEKSVPDDAAVYYSTALALFETGKFLDWSAELLQSYLDRPIEGGEPSAALARAKLDAIAAKRVSRK